MGLLNPCEKVIMAYIKNDLRRSYCFCIYVGWRRYEGDSERIALEKLFAAFGTCYGDIKTVLNKCGIPCELIPQDEQKALDMMFGRLKTFDVGSWMWYDGELQDQWRLNSERNAIILKAAWQRKPLSEETKRRLQKSLERANAVKAEHPECYDTEKFHSTRTFKNVRHVVTESQRRHMNEGIRRFWANVTPERKAEIKAAVAAGRKNSNAGRQAAEVVTLGEGDALDRCITFAELRQRYADEVEKYDKHESMHGKRMNAIVRKYRTTKPVIEELDGRKFVMMLLVGKQEDTLKWGVCERPYCLVENCRHHF